MRILIPTILIAANVSVCCGQLVIGSANLSSFSVSDAGYYVSNSGDDSASGHLSSPWKTLAHAATNINSGDVLTLWAGQTFTGPLAFTNQNFTSRVRITSDPHNRAKISASGSFGAVASWCTPNIQIDNLILTTTTNGATTGLAGGCISNVGAIFWNTNSYMLAGPVITNCLITNCFSGISMIGTPGSGGWTNWSITYNSISNCEDYGIITAASNTLYTFSTSDKDYGLMRDGYTAHNNIGWIYGNSSYMIGNVIGLYQAANVISEYEFLHDSGAGTGDGPFGGAGAWVCGYSTNCLIRFSEAARIHANAGNVDGAGFDFDFQATNCLVYACYAHDCDSGGLFDYSGSKVNEGNTFAYNLTVNNNQKGLSGEVLLQGTEHNFKFYNNTLLGLTATVSAPYTLACQASTLTSALIANNIFIANWGSIAGFALSAPTLPSGTLVNNDYAALGAFTLPFVYNNTSYSTLAAFRSGTGQETGTGFTSDPQLVSMANPGDAWPNPPSSIISPRLGASSPMISAGVSLVSYGIQATNDFMGISTTSTNSVGAYSQ